ncbi:hypothetical protein [Teredinibacter haidensis]|uniref:hypothetical protein n=1 Tax=Teredinibacter haidensis TaxID=2731755 RepID=UPI000948FF14|nr:hypothetical protein [Teredinibacter haidensis]
MYYLLDTQDAEYPCRWIDDEPHIKDVNTRLGRKLDVTVPQPLSFSLQPLDPLARDQGAEMPAVFVENYLLFRDDFIAALLECGVNNFDMYTVEIEDPDNGAIHTNYKAVNILGLVRAADLEKSDATVHDNVPLFDVDFEKLVLDPEKTFGLELFRLAEANTAILIHKRVKDFLLMKGFSHVCFGGLETSAL